VLEILAPCVWQFLNTIAPHSAVVACASFAIVGVVANPLICRQALGPVAEDESDPSALSHIETAFPRAVDIFERGIRAAILVCHVCVGVEAGTMFEALVAVPAA
jgi:hypothetical protein